VPSVVMLSNIVLSVTLPSLMPCHFRIRLRQFRVTAALLDPLINANRDSVSRVIVIDKKA
jgi:hypothetical protein